jgi:hypothetical protein
MAQYSSPRVAERRTGFGSIRRAELVSATPVVPTKVETSTKNSVKVATSNLFIENEPEVVVDNIIETLFDQISSKEILGFGNANNVNPAFQIAGLTDNISNIAEVSNSISSKNILPIKTRAAAIAEDIANYDPSVSYDGVITIEVSSPNARTTNKVVLQVLEPETFLTLGNWGA